MDIITYAAAVAAAKTIPGTAGQAAVAAAERAEAAAANAQTHNYGIAVNGTTLTITAPTGA